MGKSLGSPAIKFRHHLKRIIAVASTTTKSPIQASHKSLSLPPSEVGIWFQQPKNLEAMRNGAADDAGASSGSLAGGAARQDGSVAIAVDKQPLSEVVGECVQRWYHDTLKEAKAGDLNMQVLVSQMYYSGYGVARDAHKGRIWMARAARHRASVWKVSDKHPGYNASDSDSDELKGES